VGHLRFERCPDITTWHLIRVQETGQSTNQLKQYGSNKQFIEDIGIYTNIN